MVTLLRCMARRPHKLARTRRRLGWLVCSQFVLGGLVLSAGLAAQSAPSSGADFPSLLQEGFRLHQQAQYAASLPLLERALKLEPHDYYANLLVGIDLLRTGRPQDALPHLHEAALRKPSDDLAFDYLTEAYATLHRYADADEASAHAVQVAPSSDQALQSAIGLGLERFRALSAELRSTTSGVAAEQRLQAMAHPISDPRRLELLRSSAATDPAAPGIWSDLAEAEAAQGKTEEANADQAKARSLLQDPLAGKHVAASGKALTQASGEMWLHRGELLAKAGKWSPAAVALERSLDHGVRSTYALYLLCWTYAQRTGEIASTLQSRTRDDAEARMVRGDVLLRMQNNPAAALAEYTAALSARPGDPALLERMAEAQLQQGQMDAAVQSAQAALSVDPHRLSAMQTLARVAMDQRRYADAMPYLKQIYEFDPSNIGAEVELGTALARTGDAAAAVPLLAAPLQHGYPDQKGSLHALLGSQLRKVGREEEASQAFAQARSLSEQYQKVSHATTEDNEP